MRLEAISDICPLSEICTHFLWKLPVCCPSQSSLKNKKHLPGRATLTLYGRRLTGFQPVEFPGKPDVQFGRGERSNARSTKTLHPWRQKKVFQIKHLGHILSRPLSHYLGDNGWITARRQPGIPQTSHVDLRSSFVVRGITPAVGYFTAEYIESSSQ